jgi:hypothetical protein
MLFYCRSLDSRHQCTSNSQLVGEIDVSHQSIPNYPYFRIVKISNYTPHLTLIVRFLIDCS